ncbi:MAG: hypothetical protein HPY66_1803 [Firmicutes bacterium]|nr:hypothetical protein [Bacillota bacterium]MDI6706233.1 NAD(P)H-dependent oxidoreductase subunit E [Bacillota bacterium]
MGDAVAAFEKKLCSEEVTQVKDIVEKYAMIPGGLIPALHEAQKILGCLPRWVQEYVAERFELPVSEVNSVISYYSLFSEKPKGEYCIGACKETTCYVKSTKEIVRKIEDYLGIEAGDTNADRKYSIEILRCADACGSGLIIQITDCRC